MRHGSIRPLGEGLSVWGMIVFKLSPDQRLDPYRSQSTLCPID